MIVTSKDLPDFSRRVGFNRRLRGFAGILEPLEVQGEIEQLIRNSANILLLKHPMPNLSEAWAVYTQSIQASQDLEQLRGIPEADGLLRDAEGIGVNLRRAFITLRDNRKWDAQYSAIGSYSLWRWQTIHNATNDMVRWGHAYKNLVWENIGAIRAAYEARIKRERDAAEALRLQQLEAERAAAKAAEEQRLLVAAQAASQTTAAEVQILENQQAAVVTQAGLNKDVRRVNQASVAGVPLVPALTLGAIIFGGYYAWQRFGGKKTA